ncbi:MAG: tyrosine-type recombinase/integrase [Clostridia bacterium]
MYEDEINYQHENVKYSHKKKSSKTIRCLLSNYLSQCKTSLKKKSYQTYQSRLRVFNQFMERHKYSDLDISVISNNIIIEFFKEIINETQLDSVTIKNYRINISAFFCDLVKQKIISQNPVHDLPKAQKRKDAAPLPILPNDLKTLLITIQERDPQLYLACLIQYFCAVRPGNELHNLKVKHINFWAGTITISVLSGKMRERVINIPEQFLKILTTDYKIHNQPKDYYVFGNKRKPGEKPIGINSLRVRFNSIRDELGLCKDYKFYSMKHTGAGFLLDTGVITIKDLQEHLGHTDINSTYRYIKKYRGITTEKIKHNFPSPYSEF